MGTYRGGFFFYCLGSVSASALSIRTKSSVSSGSAGSVPSAGVSFGGASFAGVSDGLSVLVVEGVSSDGAESVLDSGLASSAPSVDFVVSTSPSSCSGGGKYFLHGVSMQPPLGLI